MQNKDEYINKLEKYIEDLENRLQGLQVSIENPSKENIIWKIRHIENGLWSGGGSPIIRGNNIYDHGQWNKNGKFWKQKGALTNHIRNHSYGGVPHNLRGNHNPDELLPHVFKWEIVSFSFFEANPIDVNMWWTNYLVKSNT